MKKLEQVQKRNKYSKANDRANRRRMKIRRGFERKFNADRRSLFFELKKENEDEIRTHVRPPPRHKI